MIGAMALKWGVRQGFAMMSRKDLVGLMRGWAKDAVFEFPGQTPISGRHEGKPAIEAFFRTIFNRLATIQFTVKQVAVAHPFALGLTNTVLCEWAVDQTSYEGVTIHMDGMSFYRIRHGRAVAGRDYFFDIEPLERIWGHRETAEAAPAAAGRA